MNINIIAKILAFFLSNLGYYEYFRRKKHIDTVFIPIFVISMQISILFVAGILNFLNICTYLIYGLGIILVIYYLVRNTKEVLPNYLKLEYLTLAIICVLLLLACSGNIFTHYDNFSHWSLVVKNMLLTDRYPTYKDNFIMFQEYPLGSSTYIYYVGKLISSSEDFQMFIQAFMIVCCIIPAFKYAKKRKIIFSIYFIIFANYLLCYNIKITELLVDTLIGLFGTTLLFFLYSNNKKNGKQKATLIYAIPFLITTMQIKNSGILFVILACIYIIKNYKEVKLLSKTKLLTLASPFISLFIWQRHCSYVFDNAARSKHAMTIDNYLVEAGSKNIYLIKDICVKFFKFMFTGRELLYTAIFMITLILLSLLVKKKLTKQILKLSLFMIFLYFIYMAGTLLMYIFSMPTYEAIQLAGIERYRKTILVVIYYLLLLESVLILQGITAKVKYIICTCSLYLLLILSWRLQSGYFTSIFDYNKESENIRLWLEDAIDEYNVKPNSSYAVCVNINDFGYTSFIVNYLLLSPNSTWFVDIKDDELQSLENYEYVFVLEENDTLRKWAKKNYPKQSDNNVIITSEKEENNETDKDKEIKEKEKKE